MAVGIARYSIGVGADPSGAVAGFATVQRKAQEMGSAVRKVQSEMTAPQSPAAMLRSIDPMLSKFKQMAAIGGAAVTGFLGWGVKLASDAETAQVSFAAMLKSGEAARSMLMRLREMAKATPFEFTDLRQAAQTLVGMGIAAGDVLPSLQMLGDISAGSGKNIGELALIFGQVSAAGRLMTQDMNQLATAGIPILDALAKKFGVTKQEVRGLVEAGKVDFAALQEAMRSMTENSGIYFKLMEQRSATLQGKWSTLMDATKELATAFGTVLVPPLLKAVNLVTPLVELLSRLDSTTVSVGLGVTAMVAGFAGAVVVAAKVSTAVRDLIVVTRQLTQVMAAQQIITQALSGPKGWGALAIGAAVAIAGLWGLDKALGTSKEGTVTATISAAEMKHNLEQEAAAAKKTADALSKAADETSEFAAITDKAFSQAAAKVAEFADTSKELDRLFDRAKDITLEMRTPEEKFRDTVEELRNLQAIGAITGETFNRAFAKANDDLNAAKGNASDLREELDGVAAATFDTVAGFSLVQELLRKNAAEAAAGKNIDFGANGVAGGGGNRFPSAQGETQQPISTETAATIGTKIGEAMQQQVAIQSASQSQRTADNQQETFWSKSLSYLDTISRATSSAATSLSKTGETIEIREVHL